MRDYAGNVGEEILCSRVRDLQPGGDRFTKTGGDIRYLTCGIPIKRQHLAAMVAHEVVHVRDAS